MREMNRKQFLHGLGALTVGSLLPRVGAADSSVASDDLLLTEATVLTMDAARHAWSPGYVWIRGGTIHCTGPMNTLGELPAGIAHRQLPGHVIMPGLVNCHTHLSNAILRGVYDEMPLEVWFSRGMWPVLDALDAEAGHAGAELALLELLRAGVTTVAGGDFGTPHPDLLDGVLDAVRISGIRAVVSRITVDSPDDSSPSQAIPPAYRESPARAADEVRRLQRQYGSPRITVAPEALGVLRCTPEMVQAMHEIAVASGAPLLMHAASSPEERAEAERRYGHGSIAQLARLGVLGPRTLLAHAIWLDDDEIALLARHRTGISHNPVANAYYAAGIARLSELLDAGVRVGLGTDGATTNNGQNVWETMKMALLFQKHRLQRAGFGSAELALELMTRGGAEALHMEAHIGSLAPGRRADLVVLDARRAALWPPQTLVSNLVYSHDRDAVRDVYVDGEPLVLDGRHQRLDESAVLARAERAARRVLGAAGLDDYLKQRSGWRWQGN